MNGSAGTRLVHPISAVGWTVLSDPNEARLDIAFLHGFTGHPERTWTHKRGDVTSQNDEHDIEDSGERPSKFRKLNLPSKLHKARSESNTTVYWPQDLVPETIPFARVLTYGYDTHIRRPLGRPANQTSIYDIAWNFLLTLEAERRSEPSRPILFVAHSLGGIVVKEMLRRASSCESHHAHLHNVFKSTIGIMFFGTPHGGADPSSFLRRTAEKVIKMIGGGFNEQVLNALLPSSERLKELRDEFSSIAVGQRWMIHSFQEELGVQYLSGHKIVEDTSSYINFPSIETTQHIGRDHMEMCRFTGFNDIEYKKVAAAFDRMTGVVSKQQKEVKRPSLNEDQIRELINSLRFEQMNTRQMSIKSAHAKTCRWLLKNREYLDWTDVNQLKEHHGFLWIKGKPGAGKSTLMKFALATTRKQKDRVVTSFFFNARGSDLERSTMGMYRSLLVQLLEQLPELQNIFESLGVSACSTSGYLEWGIESLKDLFGQAIRLLDHSSVVCFIDALDECEEIQIRDMVAFFQHLGEVAVSTTARFQVLLSSRHYPYITIAKGISLILEDQEGHKQDIASYLDNELQIGHSPLAEQIRTQIQEKASDVFMWVVLVVNMLNKEHDEGRSTRRLQKTLETIPDNLHKLFRDILIRDSRNKHELLLCIQWLLFASCPLQPEELYFAILSGTEPEDISRWDPEDVPIDKIKKFILNCSKGLTEVTKSKIPSVQFIHESVRDFLLKENGLREVWSDLGSNFQAESQERLKQCCLNYINIDTVACLNIGTPLPKASTQEAAALRQAAGREFPFLEYATQNVLYHAEEAEMGGIGQSGFIQRFSPAGWLKLHNLFERFEVRRYTPNASLLYILAENDMSALIRVHPSNGSCLDVEDERYGLPFLAALATRSLEAYNTFVQVKAEMLPQPSLMHDLFKTHFKSRNKVADLGRDFTFSPKKGVISYIVEYGEDIFLDFIIATGQIDSRDVSNRTPLSWAAEEGYVAVAELLLATGQVDPDSKDKSGRTPLLWAAENGYEAVIKLLLATGKVDPDPKDDLGQTPLLWAAEKGHEDIFKLLLATGQVDPDSKDKSDRTPLSSAARRGYEAVVKLLLATGKVDPDRKDGLGQTPLSCAAENGHEDIVKLLLATGEVDLDSKDRSDRTPLFWAARRGYEAVVKLLLATGQVNPDPKDDFGQTPLSCAVENGYEAVVKLLLATGEVDLDSKDISGETPLLWAARNGYEGIAKLLDDYRYHRSIF